MAKRQRRKFSNTEKINTVRRVKNGGTISAEATRLKCSRTMIDKWVRDPRYRSTSALPTKVEAPKRPYNRKPTTRKPKATEAMAVIATVGECPHCGGELDLRKAA